MKRESDLGQRYDKQDYDSNNSKTIRKTTREIKQAIGQQDMQYDRNKTDTIER
jgi:hypothetical protein